MPGLSLMWRLCLTLLLMAAGTVATAQTFPKFTGLVVDGANVLPPDVEASLTTRLETLQKDQKRQLVVVTVPDTQGYPLEDYGYRLGRAWGVGLSDVDNGAILLVAPGNPAGQRGPRIEVGRGLEPVLTDALSSVIINQRIMPLIRAGQVPQAVEAGTDAIIQQLAANPDEAKARTDAAAAQFDRSHRRTRAGDGGGFPVGLVFWGMVAAFVLLSFARHRGGKGQRYRGRSGGDSSGVLPIVLWGIANEIGRSRGGGGLGGWGSGGGGGGGGGGSDGSWGGGGFTGGGGGDFGGGGASGDW